MAPIPIPSTRTACSRNAKIGSLTTYVDIWRNGTKVSTPNETNDGAYIDPSIKTGGGSYTYRVCEAGTASCSNDATVVF